MTISEPAKNIFPSSQVSKFHEYMANVLELFTRRSDTKNCDIPATFKPRIESAQLSYEKTAIEADYKFLMKNKILTVSKTLPHCNVITDQFVFKLKENCESNILKYKARLVV